MGEERACARRQHGLVTSNQIVGAGLSRSQLRTLVRAGGLIPVRRGAYRLVLYMVSSRSFLFVAIVQGVLGGVTCLLVWIVVKRMTQSDGVALAAESLTAIYPPLIYYGSMLLTESIAPFWLTLAVWLLIRAIERPTAVRTASAGTALAVATLILRRRGNRLARV